MCALQLHRHDKYRKNKALFLGIDFYKVAVYNRTDLTFNKEAEVTGVVKRY